LATLSTVSAALILGNLFQLPTLLGFALQSFAPLPRSKNSFRIPLSARTFCYETDSASYRRFSGLLSPEKPCPFLLPNGLGWVGTFCSLELSDLSGFSLHWAWEKTFYFLSSLPLRPCSSPTLRSDLPGTLGSCVPNGLALSLRRGRRPVWPSSPTASTTF